MNKLLLLSCMFVGSMYGSKECVQHSWGTLCTITTPNGVCSQSHGIGSNPYTCSCKSGAKGPNYKVNERSDHKCENDCDCAGKRTCSKYGYCEGSIK